VVGRRLRKARRKILKAHCRVGKVTSTLSSTRKKDVVLRQRPKAGRRLANGARINLTIGRGPRKR
jgi:beta-lactam-binding protein with PASTA domain